jgi:hypothetical protein
LSAILISVPCCSALPLDVLQEFAVPRGMHFVTVDPVHHKLWQERTGVLLRDTGQTERFIYRRVGLPVSGNACGLRTVVHLAGVFKPPPAYMFDKTGIHFFGRTAALAPIQDEFRPDRFGKHNVDIGLSQNI